MEKNIGISFNNLLTEVIGKDLCNRCGGCVSFCSANGINALEIGEDGYPKYSDQEKCLEGGICYLICPQTKRLEEELKQKFDAKFPIGNWVDVFSARSTDENIIKVATDGGVVTSLLSYMLEHDKIDGAIVSKRIGACGKGPTIATSKEELLGTAGSYFSEALHLDKLGSEYKSCFPVLKVIQESAKKNMKKLALVGTPCQIKAIRKMQLMNIVPADMVIFTIGLFCLQCFTLEDLAKKEFAKIHNINMDDIVKVNIKDKLILTMKSGICIQVPLDIIEKIARPACIACDDFSNDYADISVGGIGSDEGFTTTLIRNSLGREIYSNALYKGYIENKHEKCMHDKVDENYLINIIKEFAIRKKARAEARLNSLIK